MARISPRQILRAVAQVAVTALLLGALAALSDVPVGEHRDEGMVRLAWRMVGSKVNICYEPTPEELAELPQHMRRPRVCSNRIIPYRLQVALDGTERIARTVTPAGARGDRPIFVQEDVRLPPGQHRLDVTFVPDAQSAREAVGLGPGTERPEVRQGLEKALDEAPRFSLERTVQVQAGRVVLVELDEGERGGLRIVTGSRGEAGGFQQ